MKTKKFIIFFFIIFVILGCFTAGYVLFSSHNKNNSQVAQNDSTDQTIATETITTREILEGKTPVAISDDELISQIKNKRYLESSYMALEYSKISNIKLIEVLKNYIEDSNGMQPEDIKEIISLHEKTFLNRYLKVYILTVDKTIDTKMADVDAEMKNALFQIKAAYANFSAYGRDAVTVDEEGVETNNGPSYDINILKLGVQNLETANSSVDKVLKTVGIADINIEKAWIDANISSDDLSSVLNKSDVVDTVDDLNSKTKKSYTSNPDNIIDDLQPTTVDDINNNTVVSPQDNKDNVYSNDSSDIPYEEDSNLDLSDLQ